MAGSLPGSVSIVVPAYDEERRIGRAVAELVALARQFPRLREVLVMVEPSGDRTAEVAQDAAGGDALVAVHTGTGHRGKGFAVRTGMLAARGDIIFFMDADLSVPLRFVPVFVEHLDRHPAAAAAIGCRRHRESTITRRQHPMREAGGRLFSYAVRALALSPSKDTQCGFKAFRRESARQIFGQVKIDGFAFDAEALFLARRLRLRVDELPVEWINDDDSKLSATRDGWRSFADLFVARFRSRHAG